MLFAVPSIVVRFACVFFLLSFVVALFIGDTVTMKCFCVRITRKV